MAITSLNSEFLWPRPIYSTSTFGLATYNLIGAGTIKIAYIFRVPKNGTIDQVEWLMSTPSTVQPMRVAFQSLTGSNPSGTTDQFRTFSPTVGWKTPGLITSDGTDSGTKRTVTKGDWVAAVMEWTGSTGDVLFSFLNNVNVGIAGYRGLINSDFYWMTFNGTTWTGYSNLEGAIFTIKYNDGTYGRFLDQTVPIQSLATEAFASNSTPDEIGLYFNLLVPMRVSGAWILLDIDAAADLVLYDTNGTTVLATTSISTVRSGNFISPAWIRFTTDIDLPIGNGYRIVVKPTTTSTVGLQVYTLNNSAHRESYPGGLNCQYTSRTDAGSWSQTTTKLPQISLVISGLDAGSSGGGETSHTFVGIMG